MLPADGMVSASDGVLDVAEQRVDPVELRVLDTGTPTPCEMAVMDVGGGVECSETPEAITDDQAPGRNGLLGVAAYPGEGEATHTAQLNTLRMALLIGLHGGNKRDLVLNAAPALSRPFTAQGSIIDLDTSGERLALVTFVHDLQQLVFELPGSVVADAKLPGQLQRRDATLALGEQVNRQEPGGQRKVRAMEDGTGGQRGLMVAVMALVESPRKLAAGRVASLGADEPLGPTMPIERLPALRFRTVLLEEGRQRQAGLEMDRITCHDATSSTGYNLSIGQAGGMVADQHE